MSHKQEILQDPRIRKIPFKDLLALTKYEVVRELLLPLPWFLGSLFLANLGFYVPALACSFMFFLAGLRLVHGAYHYSIGLSKPATESVMVLLSILMLGSMHAIQFNHLRHHKHCMSDDDVEAMSATLKGWQAVLLGPWFPIKLHLTALRLGTNRQRQWVLLELFLNMGWILMVFLCLKVSCLKYHMFVMALGQCLTAFFAVWTVHHDCDKDYIIARTIRNGLKSFVTLDMFYHMEHHLFPAIPTSKLPEVAKRLDRQAPEFKKNLVF